MGFWGCCWGVPLFASFYYLLREFINSRLRKKNLPVSTQEYIDVAGIDDNGTISYIVPNTIEFHPLFHGEDSLLAQLKQRLKHPLPALRPRMTPRILPRGRRSDTLSRSPPGGELFLCVTG